MTKSYLFRLLLGFALFWGFSTFAQKINQAEEAFQRGRVLLSEKRIAEACLLFEESHRIDPALGTLMNIGECAHQEGKHAKAHRAFVDAVNWAERSGDAKRKAVAQARLHELRPKVALIVVETDAPSTHAQLRTYASQTLELEFTAQSGLPVAIEPGVYLLELRAPGRGPVSRRVDATEGGELRVVVPQLNNGERAEPPPQAVGAVVGGGVVTASSLVGLAYAINVMARVDRQQPGGPDETNPSVTRAQFETTRILLPVSVAATVLGIATVGLGVWWWIGSRSEIALIPLEMGLLATWGGRF